MRRETAINAIKWELVPYTTAVEPKNNADKGVVLEVGSGPMKTYPHFLAVDTCDKVNYRVETLANMKDFLNEHCDAVFSSYLVQRIAEPGPAMMEWCRVLKVGGHLVLHWPRARDEGDAAEFSPDAVEALMRAWCPSGWTLLERQEREDAYLLVFRKRVDGTFDVDAWGRAATQRALTPKRVCLVRYGGYGDMLQLSSVLPELKRQGWHVTVMTEPKGREIIKEDPHVDAFLIQANDQVPNHLLGEFWGYWEKKFDRFVNYSESIEGTLLAMPGRMNHKWPLAVRQKRLNVNYFEWTAELAGVDLKHEGRFYPTPAESEWARKTRRDMKGFVVLLALAGSSVHKFYRWQDEVIGGLMRYCKRARVVTIGDEACKVLEQGWEKEPRVICRSGVWTIRETLAFARECDAIWGPETGVLNSVANEPMAKVVLLSHSSVENLTKHWTHTFSMEPVGQHCYPCHQLHYSTEFCDIDAASGVAQCQMKIAPERVLKPLIAEYEAWERRYHRLGAVPQRPAIVVTP